MRFFTRLAILFYVAIISVLCGTAILFVANVFSWEDSQFLLYLIYSDDQFQLAVGLTNGLLILLSFMVSRLIIGRQQRERTIAFDNPSGRVSISLPAMEDLIRRLIARSPEVKEVKTHLTATKKGIDVDNRLILRSDANIPEITSRLQEWVKGKIQDTIGIEGVVNVKVHVIKIVAEPSKMKKEKQKDVDEQIRSDPDVPFRGYR